MDGCVCNLVWINHLRFFLCSSRPLRYMTYILVTNCDTKQLKPCQIEKHQKMVIRSSLITTLTDESHLNFFT